MRRSLFLVLAIVLVPGALRAQDAGGGADGGGGGAEVSGPPAALPCGAIAFEGCCEGGTVFWCDELDVLQALWCGGNRTYAACGLQGPFANCMAPGTEPAARCSSEPSPPAGALPEPGDRAGTCPQFPRQLTLLADPDAPARCPAGAAAPWVVQTGCSFVLPALTGESEDLAVGQVEARAVQLSYKHARTTATCYGVVAEDDGSVAITCDGPWGFEDTACTWRYKGLFRWPAPPATGGDASGGDGQRDTSGGGDGGGGGCAAGGAGSALPLLGLLLVGLLPAANRARVRARS